MSARPTRGQRGHSVSRSVPKGWDAAGRECSPRSAQARRIELRGRYRFGVGDPWHAFRLTLAGETAHLLLRRALHLIDACGDGPPSEELLDFLTTHRRRSTPTPAPARPTGAPARPTPGAGAPLTISELCDQRLAQLTRHAVTSSTKRDLLGQRRTVHRALREYFADRDLLADPIGEEDVEEWAAWRAGVNYRTRDAHARRCARCAAHANTSDPRCADRPVEETKPRTLKFALQEFRLVLLCGRKALGAPPEVPDLARRLNAEISSVQAARDCASPEQIAAIATKMGERTVGKVSGSKWSLAVHIGGRMGLRLEEVGALFDTDFMLDVPTPYVVVTGAESRRPDDPLGVDAASRRPPLKHRAAGSTRVVQIPPDLVPLIREHIEQHAAPNGRMFTSARGGWWARDTAWLNTWWRPVINEVFGDAPNPSLRHFEFRRLRHSAITGWLYAGMSVGDAASVAGNSEAVIRKHYAGVIAEAQMRMVTLPSLAATVAPAPAALDDLDTEALFAERAAIDAEIERRQRAVLAGTPTQLPAAS